jgi:flavin-dependent dehydrogenase
MELGDGSRVGVIGGGPAGSFAAYFLLEMADRVGIDIAVDIYEPKEFVVRGPAGCNNCGGIISESLVQLLATEGINLPPNVVQRGLGSYILHSDTGTVRIDNASEERRIAAVHRGGGPRTVQGGQWDSFDNYLLDRARQKGANLISTRVENITLENGLPCIHAKGGEAVAYDLVVGAVGVNSPVLKVFEKLGFEYRKPKTTKTYIGEFFLGEETVTRKFGDSMHVFLLDMPRVEFAALIPKGDCVTLCMLGRDIDKQLVDQFLSRPEVRSCFPEEWTKLVPACHCAPRINVGAATRPFADRIVLVGDSAVTRLYKDGIGAAYRTAKASAIAAVFDGVSAEDFRKHYWPACRELEMDNRFGALVFAIVGLLRRRRFCRVGILGMVDREQTASHFQDMSIVLWNTFTGSASYRSIFLQALHPRFLLNLMLATGRGLWAGAGAADKVGVEGALR